jgi:hypothetical protein
MNGQSIGINHIHGALTNIESVGACELGHSDVADQKEAGGLRLYFENRGIFRIIEGNSLRSHTHGNIHARCGLGETPIDFSAFADATGHTRNEEWSTEGATEKFPTQIQGRLIHLWKSFRYEVQTTETCKTIAGLDILIAANLDVLVLAQLADHIKKAWLVLVLDHENPLRRGWLTSPVQGKGWSFVQADRDPSQMSAITAASGGLEQKAVNAKSLDKSGTSLF